MYSSSSTSTLGLQYSRCCWVPPLSDVKPCLEFWSLLRCALSRLGVNSLRRHNEAMTVTPLSLFTAPATSSAQISSLFSLHPGSRASGRGPCLTCSGEMHGTLCSVHASQRSRGFSSNRTFLLPESWERELHPMFSLVFLASLVHTVYVIGKWNFLRVCLWCSF